MIGSNAFNYINVLNKAAQATMERSNVIINNIANVSTPDYKRKDINFENYLKRELMKEPFNLDLDRRVAAADLSNLKATLYTDQKELSYRYDGNNVDINTENANFSENQIRYYTLLDSMQQEFSRIKTALTVK